MSLNSVISKQLKGFIDTPNLWLDKSSIDVDAFILKAPNVEIPHNSEQLNSRLGKRLEEFMAFCLEEDATISDIEKGLQIKSGKQTIGELDFLFQQSKQTIHLELAYKFYLYDPDLGDINTIKPWIGPNRNDSLCLKTEKLRHKQLPLLYKPETEPILNDLNLTSHTIKQLLCFKAQLYLPYGMSAKGLGKLNKACVAGCYLRYDQCHILESSQIYIPEKLNWVAKPHVDVEFLSYNLLKQQLFNVLEKRRSPLIWVKSQNQTLSRCFVVWW